ncbi:MAG: hypothetical protein Q8L52_01520 [bacterium]|nr:hypothetical protein [bacterium]
MKIVFLVFAPNTAYVQVIDWTPEGVKVFPDKGIWTYASPNGPPRTFRIGNSRDIGDLRGGIIGVYDADKLSHLDSMVHVAVEAQRGYAHADQVISGAKIA